MVCWYLQVVYYSQSEYSPIVVSSADNGTLHFWDWKTGYSFQRQQTVDQPGSMDSKAGIFATAFDLSGCRLITAEADKTIKIYKEESTVSYWFDLFMMLKYFMNI